MNQSSECVFCRIVEGRTSVAKVFEDDHTLAFMDIRPASEGHLLVICKEHHPDLLSITPAALSAVALTMQRLAVAQMRALEAAGLRVGQFNGAAAGQTVFHYHVHLRPVYAAGEHGSHGRHQADMARLQVVAERIRAALD